VQRGTDLSVRAGKHSRLEQAVAILRPLDTRREGEDGRGCSPRRPDKRVDITCLCCGNAFKQEASEKAMIGCYQLLSGTTVR
jgi:hypothetical protein